MAKFSKGFCVIVVEGGVKCPIQRKRFTRLCLVL